MKRALGIGRQYLVQRRVRSDESVSTLLFATAKQVAADQELIAPAVDLDDRRLTFRAELTGILRDIGYVERAAANQFLNRTLDDSAPRADTR